jgi:hypothetical protein
MLSVSCDGIIAAVVVCSIGKIATFLGTTASKSVVPIQSCREKSGKTPYFSKRDTAGMVFSWEEKLVAPLIANLMFDTAIVEEIKG